jgi:acetyl esterase/lipase
MRVYLLGGWLMKNNTTKEKAVFHTVSVDVEQDQYIQLLNNIVFCEVEGLSLKLNLLMKRNPLDILLKKKTTAARPLIIYIQGSGWGWSPLSTFANVPQLVDYAKNGYVVASIQYRVSDEAKFPAQIEDVKAAVRFLKDHAKKYSIDPNRIGVWGDSSGGHLAALLGTSSDEDSRVQAVVDWYGPTDLLQMSKYPSIIDHDAADSPESRLIGGPIQEYKELTEKANPINYISSNTPPFLIMHGDEDNIVPFNQSELLYEALKKAGNDVTFYKVQGGGHGTGFAQPHIHQIVMDFFNQHLNGSK